MERHLHYLALKNILGLFRIGLVLLALGFCAQPIAEQPIQSCLMKNLSCPRISQDPMIN